MLVGVAIILIAAVVFPGVFRFIVTLVALGFCVAVGYGGWIESQEHSAPPTSALGSSTR